MFEGFDPAEYEQEVRERWGDTEAYKESARRAAGYGPEDWRRIQAEAGSITSGFAALKRAGEPAEGAAARELALRHREHISRWFYECAPALHAGLAEMFIGDPRFAANYDRVEPGLSRYVHDAIVSL